MAVSPRFLGLFLTIFGAGTAIAQSPPVFAYTSGGVFTGFVNTNDTSQSCIAATANPTFGPDVLSTGIIIDAPAGLFTGCSAGSSLSMSEPFSTGFTIGGESDTVSGTATQNGTVAQLTASVANNSFVENSGAIVGEFSSSTIYYIRQGFTAAPGSSINLQFKVVSQLDDRGGLSQAFATVVTTNGTGSNATYPSSGAATPLESPSGTQTLTVPPLIVGDSGTYSIVLKIVVVINNGPGSESITMTPGCTLPTYPQPPPNSFSINGWSGSYAVTPKDGLELDDISLGNRYLATQMNVPYFNLNTSDFSSGSGNHCELRPDGSMAPCGAASRLVDFGTDSTSIHATYEIDQIPQNSASCLVVTQTYTLGPQTSGCEPTLQPCNRLIPLVSYTYIPGTAEETFTTMDAAQRFLFKVDGTAQGAGGNAGAFFQDSNTIPAIDLGPVTFPWGGAFTNGISTAVPSNPLATEAYFQAVNGGGPGVVDNYHQTWNPAGPSAPLFDFAFGRWNLGGGCPECVHMHWRWPSYLTNPSFGGGYPLVSPGQSVYVAVVTSQRDAHPSQDFATLVNGGTLGATTGQAFWHGGESVLASDSFFPYGIFFLPGGDTSPSNQVHTILSGFAYNASAKMFTQTVTLTNSGLSALTGPFWLALDSLSPNATLADADGTTQTTMPLGSPYINVDLYPANQIPAGGSASVVLWFSDPTMKGITYTPRIVTGGLP